jgi:hypothetical protein
MAAVVVEKSTLVVGRGRGGLWRLKVEEKCPASWRARESIKYSLVLKVRRRDVDVLVAVPKWGCWLILQGVLANDDGTGNPSPGALQSC